MGIEFWDDPAATAATLPSGLSPDSKSNGHAVMMFLDWQFTAQDDEHVDPARYRYREAFVLLDAMHRNAPVMWCPYVFGDNDAALARGWTQGFPKKIGSIFQMPASRLAMALFVLSFWFAIAGRLPMALMGVMPFDPLHRAFCARPRQPLSRRRRPLNR